MAKKTGVAADPGPEGEQPEPVVTKIVVERLTRATMEVDIVGTSPVIPHRWSEKARAMMRAKQFGQTVQKPGPKNPQEDADESMYWLPGKKPGLPAVSFKGAMADAARYFGKTVTMEDLKRVIYVFGEIGTDGMPLVELKGELTMREDQPRNSGGVADLRYRYMVWPWKATLKIRFIESMISPEAIVNIVDAAGISGVGDWRPGSPKSKTGTFGTFEVVG